MGSEVLTIKPQGLLHGVDPAWLRMQTEQLQSCLCEPKMGNPNDDQIGDSIKESLLILLGVKIHLR